ncbi:MAG: hypothetical protein WCQ57_14110 [Verrucomicrobiota bacterium]
MFIIFQCPDTQGTNTYSNVFLKGNTMTNVPVSGSTPEQKPAVAPATPQQQTQGTPKPAETAKPNEQQK